MNKPDKMRLTVEQIQTLNKNTAAHFGPMWIQNARDNKRIYKRHYQVGDIVREQERQFQKTGDCDWHHKIAMICGSGPSLQHTIPLLKEFRDDFVIFCADTTWPILCKAGVLPDYVVTLDCGKDVIKAFPVDLMPMSRKVGLLMSNVSPRGILSRWAGKVYYYTTWNPEVPLLVKCEKMFKGVKPLVSRLNVGEFMIYNVGVSLGWHHREIAITGVDYAFPERRKYYTDGAEHIHLFDDLNHTFQAQLNNFGQACYTQDEFRHYAENFWDAWLALYKDWTIYWLGQGIVPLSYDKAALAYRLKVMRETK